MNLLPLSETRHYILLALREPLHGYAIMKTVYNLSERTVNLAAGTLYGAIDSLQKEGYIKLIHSNNPRTKVYSITEEGEKVLYKENHRLKRLIKIFEEGEK
ncbi:PadR family transcriptional regulator [Staphylococcus felis]|uniref:PadR family transcriptional regulator n=1 Tax=Staphylococcus felis TaxID=46127 RepID=UPI0024803DAA|nr:PadR family transcriptional regulator [Staphylococcus felis]